MNLGNKGHGNFGPDLVLYLIVIPIAVCALISTIGALSARPIVRALDLPAAATLPVGIMVVMSLLYAVLEGIVYYDRRETARRKAEHARRDAAFHQEADEATKEIK